MLHVHADGQRLPARHVRRQRRLQPILDALAAAPTSRTPAAPRTARTADSRSTSRAPLPRRQLDPAQPLDERFHARVHVLSLSFLRARLAAAWRARTSTPTARRRAARACRRAYARVSWSPPPGCAGLDRLHELRQLLERRPRAGARRRSARRTPCPPAPAAARSTRGSRRPRPWPPARGSPAAAPASAEARLELRRLGLVAQVGVALGLEVAQRLAHVAVALLDRRQPVGDEKADDERHHAPRR